MVKNNHESRNLLERSLSAKKLHQLVSMVLKVMFFYLLG
jgi:hypothetical protein